MDERAFSQDGYIVCQSRTAGIPYGRFDSPYNGCGWIAAYNLLRALEGESDWAAVHSAFAARLPLAGMMGTPVTTLRRCLALHGAATRVVWGKRAAARAMESAAGGILRYLEGREPHYVAFAAAGEGKHRFFNVNEECPELTASAQEFLRAHVRFPVLHAIIAE